MSGTMRAVVLGLFTLASGVWVGGYVAIVVVARVATRTLTPAHRVAFFRALGRAYLGVGFPALLVALGTGAGLAIGRRWDATFSAAAGVAAALVAALLLGVVQARRMGRLRGFALAAPEDAVRQRQVRRAARAAAALRGGIGLLTLALIALGSLLAS